MSQYLIALYLVLLLHVSDVYCEQEYTVNTRKCKIANPELFSEETAGIFTHRDYINCTNVPLLTYITKLNNTAILHIRKDVISYYSSSYSSSHGVDCCYSNITRDDTLAYPDYAIRISDCKFFQDQVTLQHDNILVKCESNGSLVYENVHNPIIINDIVTEKLKNKKGNPISVLMIVTDSISRLNLKRTMPKTRQFLIDNEFIEMMGHTKVEDNTFPNFMSIFAGFSLHQTMKFCNPYIRNKLDQCPLLWYDYRNLGYITAYAEDFDSINTFTFGGKSGFVAPPTDYYLKSHMAVAETLHLRKTFNMPFCTGPESSGERILNLAKDFSETFRNDPSFGVFWMNTFSHNDVNSPYMMDAKMKEFFKYFKENGLLDDRIVILLSDHGIRFGNIRFTRTGWLEERMPVSMISVPKKFQQKFKEEYENLKENSKKLTSHYDLFMTLQHVLTLSGLPHETRQSTACSKCTSLFKTIPKERSCQDAGILPEWCTCAGFFQPINSDSQYVKNATKFCNHVFCGETDFTKNKIISSSVSETDPGDGSRYVYVSLKAKNNQTYLLTSKFKNYIDHNSIFHVLKFSW